MTAPTPHAALVDAVKAALWANRGDRDKAARAAIAAVREALREPDARMQEAMHYSPLYLGIWQRGLGASPLAEDGDD